MDKYPYSALANYIDLLLDAICVVDPAGRYLFVSAGFERVFGYPPEEVIGRSMIELVHPDDRARTLQAAAEIMTGQPKVNFGNRYLRKDGGVVHVHWSARWSESDQVRVAVARDVTELKHAESMQRAVYAISEAAYASEDLLSLYRNVHRIIAGLLPARNFSIALYDPASDELDFPYQADERAVTATATTTIVAGAAATAATGVTDVAAAKLCGEVIRGARALIVHEGVEPGPSDVAGRIGGTPAGSWLGVPLRTRDGIIGAIAVRSDAGEPRYTDRDRELLEFVSTQIATAIQRKQFADRLAYSALHDQLTRLPNRQLFYDRIQVALAKARREQSVFALLYLDLDRFKQVNDTFGHAVGDTLLRLAAQRILDCVRSSDTVARFGGDEFVVLVERLDSPDGALRVAEKVREALNQPYEIAARIVFVPPSIGVALYPAHGVDERQLLLHADAAMYLAKQSGGDQFQLSDTAGR